MLTVTRRLQFWDQKTLIGMAAGYRRLPDNRCDGGDIAVLTEF
jgi:hypothetical protein